MQRLSLIQDSLERLMTLPTANKNPQLIHRVL